MQITRGIQQVCSLIQMDIINVDINVDNTVLLVSTIQHCNIAQLIIKL